MSGGGSLQARTDSRSIDWGDLWRQAQRLEWENMEECSGICWARWLNAVVFTGLVGKCGHVCHVMHSNQINCVIN